MTESAVILIWLIVVLYLLPTVIAFWRGRHTGRVLVMNVGLGWTGIGWLVSLIEALG